MMRHFVAVISGYAAWTLLWLAGNALFLSEAAETVQAGTPFTKVGPLIGALALSVICSLLAGYTAASLGRPMREPAVTITGILLLVTGIVVQAGAWAWMPLWYHVAFLLLLLPVVILGGSLVRGG